MSRIDFIELAQSMRDELVERRRDLHRHPELAFEEVRTSGIVAEELDRLGLEVQRGVGKTGVVGLLEGDSEGPTVIVRADMDALPIEELNETDYVSTVPGKMHACGHDGHTTIALGVAKLLANHRDQIAGRVKFVFQPAEEIGAGAMAMVKDGVLSDPKPDVALGLHIWNSLPLGTIGYAEGPMMAGSSDLTIKIRGKGSHGALPHLGTDPVVCAAQVITGLQTIVSRNLDPLDGAVISIGVMRAGTAFNILPEYVELQGTIRMFKHSVRDQVDARVKEVTEGICQAMGCTAEVKIVHFTEPVVNDGAVISRVIPAFDGMVDATKFEANYRTMAAEDVSYLMQGVPGLFFFVGSANAGRGLDYGHHHPRFDFDEDVLPLSVALLSRAVAEYVIPEN